LFLRRLIDLDLNPFLLLNTPLTNPKLLTHPNIPIPTLNTTSHHHPILPKAIQRIHTDLIAFLTQIVLLINIFLIATFNAVSFDFGGVALGVELLEGFFEVLFLGV
jgi:hypothetical protein